MADGMFDLLGMQGVVFSHTNVSSAATVGFEEKEGKNSMYAQLTLATFPVHAYISFILGFSSVAVTAAQAKTLLGVTAGERINLYGELFADSLDGARNGSLQVRFFNESGVQQGDMEEVEIETAEVWNQLSKGITVPSGATRVNFYLHAYCELDETVKIWAANVKITR